jgi:hypothetical protein
VGSSPGNLSWVSFLMIKRFRRASWTYSTSWRTSLVTPKRLKYCNSSSTWICGVVAVTTWGHFQIKVRVRVSLHVERCLSLVDDCARNSKGLYCESWTVSQNNAFFNEKILVKSKLFTCDGAAAAALCTRTPLLSYWHSNHVLRFRMIIRQSSSLSFQKLMLQCDSLLRKG